MTIDRDRKYQEMAVRSKYRKLHAYLCGLSTPVWKTSFDEIESILEFELPASARLHRPWWSNQKSGNGHSQALAWTVAGWETAEVDMEAQTLLLRRKALEDARRFSLEEVWPVHTVGAWPESLSLRREDIYDERI